MAAKGDGTLEAKIDRLIEALGRDDIEILSHEEIEILRKIIKIEDRYPGSLERLAKGHATMIDIGVMGDGVKSVLSWLAFMAAIFLAVKSGLIGWIADELARRK